MSGFFTRILCLSLVFLLVACTVTPRHLSEQAHASRASRDRKALRTYVEPVKQPISLANAMARAIKYNLGHNLKMMEEALVMGQTQLSGQEMLPKLAVQAGYTSRNNSSGSSSISLITGMQSLEPSSSIQRESAVADLSVAWNVLDFGLSYIRANQQADRFLMARERRRKVVHDIIQNVRQAFWKAVAAQQLIPEIEDFLANAYQVLDDSRQAEQPLTQSQIKALTQIKTLAQMKALAPVKALGYQMKLLETIYQVTTLQRTLSVAKTQLAALINLELKRDFTLEVPKDDKMRQIPLFPYSVDTMENMAMVLRPELREEDYLGRMDASEVHLAILKLMPGLEVGGHHYRSNDRLLFHQSWIQGSLHVAWNLVNLAKGPSLFSMIKARKKTAWIRRLATSMAVLSQVHVSKIHYDQTQKEYDLVRQMMDIDERVQHYTRYAGKLRTKTDMERIQFQAQAIYRKYQKEMAYADLQNAAGRLYLSIGIDPLPKILESHRLDDLSKTLETALQHWDQYFQRSLKHPSIRMDPLPEILESYDLEALSRSLDAVPHH